MSFNEAWRLHRAGDLDEAQAAICRALNDNPDDINSLFLAGNINIGANRFGMAYNLCKRVLDLKPTHDGAWNNLGHCLHGMQRYDEAAECFAKSLIHGGDHFDPYNNMLLINVVQGNPDKALELYEIAKWHSGGDEGSLKDLRSNIALALLCKKMWTPGWEAFDSMLSKYKQRKELHYGSAPTWDGRGGIEVVAYGEQGIGDELMFASMIPDAMEDATIVIDCDKRLEGLFRRSFGCTVYGTRFQKAEKDWVRNHQVQARVAMGSLGRLYRQRSEDFPRQPYLKACPVRRDMCRHLLSKYPGRKMGLAWTGGLKNTNSQDRSLTPDQLSPLLSVPGVTWVNLEYKGSDPERGILHFPWITQSNDYDDTAALVAELDGVVSVTTAVALLAGALGTPAQVLVPEHATWHWGKDGDFPWYPLTLHRRQGNDWGSVIKEVMACLTGT